MIRFIATSVLAAFVGLGVYTASVSQTDAQAVCKFAANAAYDDGCAATATASGALSTSSHQFPTVLKSYGANRPPFNVAGVDYPVGLPAGAALIDPSKGPWPAGCEWGGHTLSCTGSHVSIKGFDFSGAQLRINGGSGVVVTGNKFGLTSTCIDATLDFHLEAGAKMTVAYNDFEGAGSLCKSLLVGGMINGVYEDQATLILTYNYFHATPQDAIDNRGPISGAGKIIMEYNYFDVQGFSGHPDGIQLNGGNFDGSVLKFNTFYLPAGSSSMISQPLHVDAQLTSAISNSIVAFNTVMAPGTCNGGRQWPIGCSINYAIACKNEKFSTWVDTNTGFRAYGNYIDWSGGAAALTNSYGCLDAVFGKPNPDNIDLKTGKVLTP